MALREEIEKQGNWFFKRRSYLPLLIIPIAIIALRNAEFLKRAAGDPADDLFEGLCVAISFLGLVLRCIVAGYAPEGTSGRNTKGQYAKTLNTKGVYSLIRHPLYLGNFMIFLGITLFLRSWWFTLLSITAFWLYYERIMFAEEEFLRREFGDPYLKWAEKVPALIPNFKNWQRPDLEFSFKTVLRREYSGFFGMVAAFTLLEFSSAIFTEGKIELSLNWALIFITSLIIYLILLLLKMKTRILNVKR